MLWRPRHSMPYPKQQTQTHIFIDLCRTCCSCYGDSIWRVGRPRPTMPYHKQQTQTHIFIELCRTCCLCYGEGAIASQASLFT